MLSYSGSSDCTALSGLQLSAGTTCTLGIEFNPQQVGYLSGYVNVVDNSQNAQGPAYATQVIPVLGTGIPKTTGSPTLTALVVSPSPALLGASVTLTATVATSGTKTPTGMVTFKDGPTVLGATALNGSAVATYSTSSLAQGSHGLTAVYGGDANNAGSTSTIVGEPVNLATTTTVVASNLNPALTGSFITFTATVTTNAPRLWWGR